jgi:Mg2+/Co2+ transporter CorC
MKLMYNNVKNRMYLQSYEWCKKKKFNIYKLLRCLNIIMDHKKISLILREFFFAISNATIDS